MNEISLPKVSVITGFYNRGPLLSRTLDSLLAQTYPNLEIIVFDDCSSDDTAEKLKAYAALGDTRLSILLHERNKGFTQGMIDAISMASGEFIAVQGSGDSSEPTRIEKQVALFHSRPDIGVVGCHYENIVQDQGIVRVRTPNADLVTFESLLGGNVFTHGEVMIRRSAYEKVGGYRPLLKYCQDYDLWLRIIRSYNFGTVPEVLYKRYILSESVSYSPKKSVEQARYFLLCQRLATMPSSEQSTVLELLDHQGMNAIIPMNDKILMKRLFRNSLRQVVWGKEEQARELASHIENVPMKAAVSLASDVFQKRFFSLPKKALHRLLGIQEGPQ